MENPITIGQMRQILSTNKSEWFIDPKLNDQAKIPRYALGGDLSKVPHIKDTPRIDITQHLNKETSNPFLRTLRVNSGFLKAVPIQDTLLHPIKTGIQEEHHIQMNGISTAVDWRNRFGWNWLTNPKDQGGCESCWVFSAVGVVEAMTRIEHGYWSLRSEGDVHDGLNVVCAQTGSPVTAFEWMKHNGVADPGCRPYQTNNMPVPPTPDRSGRTVRLSDYVGLSNIADQKKWIDQVGPISACFTVYNDFFAFGFSHNTGVYKANTSSGVAGGHCIVIVGYDDNRQAWLIRNSWAGWGMAGSLGYAWIGYGQSDIDSYTKYGVNGNAVNPDPYTKRRTHNGNLYESGDGPVNRNFEVWVAGPNNTIEHYWRDGVSLKWSLAETQGNDCAGTPTVTGTTYNRNFEMIYPTTSNTLHHRFFDQSTGTWKDGPVFGPHNVHGVVGFIQSDYGAPGSFEVVAALTNHTLTHWSRNEMGFAWSQKETFGSNIAFGSATLVERFDRGLDYIAVNLDGTMQRYFKPYGVNTWTACEKFGSKVNNPPVMIRSQFGATEENVPGNYELCVVVNGQIQHWWTAGEHAAAWTNSATFGSGIKSILGLLEGSFGFDLELIALLENDKVQHFYRSNNWYAGPVFGSSPVTVF